MGNDLMIPLLLIGGVILYVKRCEWLKICDSPSPSPPDTTATAPAAAATADTSGLSDNAIKMATTNPDGTTSSTTTKKPSKHHTKKVAVKRGKNGTKVVVPLSSSSSDSAGCISGIIPSTDPRCQAYLKSSGYTRISI